MSFKISAKPKIGKTKTKPGIALPSFADDEGEEESGAAGSTTDATQAACADLQKQGADQAQRGNWTEALSLWERALRMCPDNADIHISKAKGYLQLQRDWDAIQAATRACSLAPSSSEALLLLSNAQLNYGEPQLALKSLERVLQLQPDHPEAAAELGNVRMLALEHAKRPAGTRAVVLPAKQ